MKIKDVIFEDFINYKKPSMFIAMPNCNFKCDRECGRQLCQNWALANEPTKDIDGTVLLKAYKQDSITSAIVFGGLEPMDSMFELLVFIDALRTEYKCEDDVVIYTGYTEEELEQGNIEPQPNLEHQAQREMAWKAIKSFNNIIVKFGRYVPDQEPHYDEVLGVNLASPNQYGKFVSDWPPMVRLNKDLEHVRLVQEKVNQNDGYCPCALEKTKDTYCMCKEFRDQLARNELGPCHCGLYVIEPKFTIGDALYANTLKS